MKYFKQTLLLFFIFNSISTAQETASATAMGSFALLGYSTVTRLADLNFGDLTVGTNVTVAPTDANAAEFLFNGSSNTVVNVTITFPSVLTCGTNTMTFSELNKGTLYNTISDVSTATEFKGKNWSASTGTDGNLYIWTGGRVRVANNQAAGSYMGVILIVVTQ